MTTTEHWFRWHHGTVTDPKWRVIATRACNAMKRHVTPASVIAVWAAMLECASQSQPRGTLVGWCDEDVAAALGLDEEEVAGIREAMQGKTLSGDTMPAWDRRQPKREREDSGSSARVAAHRERKRQDASGNAHGAHVTPSNATSRQGTPRGEERRVEEIRPTSPSESTTTHPAPPTSDATTVRVFENGFEGHGTALPEASTETPMPVRCAVALRALGVRINAAHPELIAACARGVTVAMLTDMRATYPDKPAGYLIAACVRQLDEGARPRAGPSGKPNATDAVNGKDFAAGAWTHPDLQKRMDANSSLDLDSVNF